MEEKVKEIIQRYSGDKSYLDPILQDVQKEFKDPQEIREEGSD